MIIFAPRARNENEISPQIESESILIDLPLHFQSTQFIISRQGITLQCMTLIDQNTHHWAAKM